MLPRAWCSRATAFLYVATPRIDISPHWTEALSTANGPALRRSDLSVFVIHSESLPNEPLLSQGSYASSLSDLSSSHLLCHISFDFFALSRCFWFFHFCLRGSKKSTASSGFTKPWSFLSELHFAFSIDSFFGFLGFPVRSLNRRPRKISDNDDHLRESKCKSSKV